MFSPMEDLHFLQAIQLDNLPLTDLTSHKIDPHF